MCHSKQGPIFDVSITLPLIQPNMSTNGNLRSMCSHPDIVSPKYNPERIVRSMTLRKVPTYNDESDVGMVEAVSTNFLRNQSWTLKCGMTRNATFGVLRNRKGKLAKLQKSRMTGLQLGRRRPSQIKSSCKSETWWQPSWTCQNKLLNSSSTQPLFDLKGESVSQYSMLWNTSSSTRSGQQRFVRQMKSTKTSTPKLAKSLKGLEIISSTTTSSSPR